MKKSQKIKNLHKSGLVENATEFCLFFWYDFQYDFMFTRVVVVSIEFNQHRNLTRPSKNKKKLRTNKKITVKLVFLLRFRVG
jgi:hypothetical protein